MRKSIIKKYTFVARGADRPLEDKKYSLKTNGNYFFIRKDTIVVQPGTYNHSFKCILPAHLPSSVGGKFGCIHYGVRVVLDYKLWPDKEFNWKFTVRKARHLNAEPAMRVRNLLCF